MILPDAALPSSPCLVRPGSAAAPAVGFSLSFSLYLDAWRLFAAACVIVCHLGHRRMSGGLLWQLTPYGPEAVDVFFVLSGLVIANVAATRERDWRAFAASRVARLWSVAVPALLLTFALDAAGRALAPGAYVSMPGAPERVPVAMQAAAGLLFFAQFWHWDIPIGTNVPWWSLGYEVPYYVAFGMLRFGKGAVRRLLPLVLAAVAGPSIVILAVLWFAGAALAQRWRGWSPPRGLALMPPVGWVVYELLCHRFGRPVGLIPGIRPETLQDLVVGGLFALHLATVRRWLDSVRRVPAWLARAIRFGAARSFSLYLMHFPVMLFLHAAMLRVAPGASPLWLLPATVGVCLGLAEVTERRKGDWRRVLRVAAA